MVYYLIDKIAIVRNDYDTPLEMPQIIFQQIKGYNIEIIGRLVKHKEIGIAHQYRT